MIYIVALSAIAFLLILNGASELYIFLMYIPSYILKLELWRLITWIFLPYGSNILFVAITLYFYYFIGSTLEREWGTAKFTLYYISGILLNVIYASIMWFIFGTFVIISPVYLNLSMFLAFAVLFPDVTVRLFFIIPIKVKWLALVNCFFFLYSVIENIIYGQYFSALIPFIALFNFFVFCGDDLLAYLRPLKARTSPQTINFKQAAKKARRELEDKPYRHKCAVCGVTDTDNPEKEFRYCSQCSGYHCFCSEHINNHIHFR